MLVDEINRMVDESANRLLQSSSPSMRYWVLKDILGKDREDLSVQRALEDCERYPPRLRLLQGIGPDGTWATPRGTGRGVHSRIRDEAYMTHMAVLGNLLKLLHFVTPPGDPRVDASLEWLLGRQAPEGYIRGPVSHGLPQPHHNGFALYVLVGLSAEEHRRLNRVAEWLISSQRRDGGWNMPYLQDVRYLPEYKGLGMDEFVALMKTDEKGRHGPAELQDVPSCHWTTVMVLWGLNEMVWTRRSKCVERGTDFLLGRFFQRNPHPNFYESERNWTAAKYPHNKCSGLAALDVLTKAGRGPDDPRMEKPIRWLMSARYRDGLWSDSDRPHTETGQWITLIALWVLSQYAKRL
ncbi:MAG: prenyltransferase/squalene oxidase repeat-containing protein [Candidatus Thermoplasmatota archaeon]